MRVAILAVGVALYLVLQPLVKAAKRANRRMLNEQKVQNEATAEVVTLAGQIKAYGVTDKFWNRLMSQTRRVLVEKKSAQLLAGYVPILYQSAALLVALAILAYAAVRPVDVPALGAVALLLLRSLSSAQGIQAAFVRYAEFRPVLDHLEEWNAVYATNRDHPGRHPVDTIDSLVLDEVAFRYAADDGAPALESLSLRLEAGDDVGLVGPSGAGKSTLAQILLRFRTPAQGRYLVNGVDAREVVADSFVREVAYVPQNPTILRGTVHDNITMFRDQITRERVVDAARLAGVDSWIAGASRRLRHGDRARHARVLRWSGPAPLHRSGARGSAVLARARRAHERP